ncbi:YfiR family protein [Azospirillum sp. TSO35-2]|uniref:YfiR family protein n=1 Tax=Azospirillum sp. TSO35-2 TaxID=716796 RepID=UPI000D646F34|nr:YfiR family protein [Azospirillum sp. TSO35-2]
MALTLAGTAASPAVAAETLEAAVKATFLYKFIAFVSWPDSAFPDPSSPFVLCVEGPDPFGELLDRAVAGQSAAGRPITLWRAPRFEAGSGCHLLYSRSSPGRLRGAPVLTVTDGDSAVDTGAGAVVTFVLRDDRVRFIIDAAAAQDNHLTISSKLMSLAVAVRR